MYQKTGFYVITKDKFLISKAIECVFVAHSQQFEDEESSQNKPYDPIRWAASSAIYSISEKTTFTLDNILNTINKALEY